MADVSQLLVTRDGHGTPRNDGHGWVEALGDSVMTGPALTSVNDFRAIMIVRTIVVD